MVTFYVLRATCSPLLDVSKCLLKQSDDVLVVEGVKHLSAGATGPHEPHAAQQTELMRDRRLADTEDACEIADAQLAARERIQNPDACGIAEQPEGIGDARHGVVTRQPTAPLGDARVIGVMRHVARVGIGELLGDGNRVADRHTRHI